uniref:Uncharacterized protein n=1 Tax=Romanomermis culicivorax TaxID=13658 RepID=A0A915K3I3_ROMCU
MTRNLKNLETRIDNIRSQLETKMQSGGVAQESRDGDRDTDSSYSMKAATLKRAKRASKGDFEEGYRVGFSDAQKLPSGSVARRHMDEEYGTMRGDFHAGYIQGLRDAGMQGLSQSMQHLAMSRAPRDAGGYSAGYMQDSDKKLKDSVDYLTDRISTLERTKLTEREISAGGDEIHTTKIYHVCTLFLFGNCANFLNSDNQLPEASIGYQATGQRLAQELEELSETSKRSTLRRHYTPGDYLKYASDTEGGIGSLQRRQARRSMSASNLAQEDYRARSTERTSINQYNDTYSRRYNYRARSDLGSLPRRYPSQTLLDGVRPGPATPHYREAVETLQRELGSLSKSGLGTGAVGRASSSYRRPAGTMGAGYSSDTGYNLYDTVKTIRPQPATDQGDFRYTSSQSYSRSEKQTYGAETVSPGAPTMTAGAPVGPQLSIDSQKYSTAAASPSSTAGVLGGTRNIPIHVSSSATERYAGGRAGLTGSPLSSVSSQEPHYPAANRQTAVAASSHAAVASSSSRTAAVGGGDSLNQAYNLVGLTSATAADSSGSEAAHPRGETSWTDELMRIAQEPMPQTMERMKSYSASLSRMPPSPSPRRTDSREFYPIPCDKQSAV